MYKDMVQLLSPTENGDFKLEHFEIRNGNLRAILDGINPGNYVRLMHRGEVVMSDTYMEKRTNGRTLTCIGFKPMDAETIDKVGKKYHLYM